MVDAAEEATAEGDGDWDKDDVVERDAARGERKGELCSQVVTNIACECAPCVELDFEDCVSEEAFVCSESDDFLPGQA